MFFNVLEYVYSESVFNTLHIEIIQKRKKNSFGQNKQYKKYPLLSLARSNSSQFYF